MTKDRGFVVAAEKGYAQVKVDCLSACQECSVHSLCIGGGKTPGLLSVLNPLSACPGDEVWIEVPESRYARTLSVLFGILLGAAVIGLAAGYLASRLIPVSADQGALAGLTAAVAIAFLVLGRYLRRENRKNLYPVIIAIIEKGTTHA